MHQLYTQLQKCTYVHSCVSEGISHRADVIPVFSVAAEKKTNVSAVAGLWDMPAAASSNWASVY